MLVDLEMANNRLTSIPEEIGRLTSLQRFTASGNLLQALPASIGALVDLVFLDVKENQIKTVPDTLGNLKKLQRMDLSHNMVTKLPCEMGDLADTLQVLDVEHNPLNIPPGPEVLKGTTSMLRWLKVHERDIKEGRVSVLGVVDITKKT
eukprot:TRINITY_DN2715_c0_g2_i4.p1 TRINITY_DN2715_c0_g2~~TRINITY_DN2715_c0_g2_i4.p1  ORF type:complete len:149 (+),score=31.55 TRINITY_DN2715_c0_g2_i4:190-636(+)